MTDQTPPLSVEPENSQGPATYPPDTPILAARRKAFDDPTIANLDALIAAVRAERPPESEPPAPAQGAAWQPIETAPTDGTKVIVQTRGGSIALVSAEVGVVEEGWAWCAVNEGEHPRDWDDGVCWASNADGEESDQPVRWIPAPPTEADR